MTQQKLVSIVIPVYNEADNLPLLYKEIIKNINQLPYQFEIIFIDDGSEDESTAILQQLEARDPNVHLLELARNFGKEAAESAGLHEAKGDAAIAMDADLQMPPRLLCEFIKRWEGGADIVIGVFASRSMSGLRRLGAHWFYRIMQAIGHGKVMPNATDYRLLDRQVIDSFKQLTEHNRITRGLIDWLGYKRAYVYFKQEPRHSGQPNYSFRKLVALAINSFTSNSLLPLKLAGYLGVFILTISIPAGLFMYIERYIMHDPMRLLFNGVDMLAILILFLVGVILACLGLISLYIANIHAEVTNRPLYVIREKPSVPELAEVPVLAIEAAQDQSADEAAALPQEVAKA
ncbi:MAG TPA: glycosyltransferase family 2 protein [Patescibacteria group bacterium]|nr:glycosyltransferase family 2 protein [Patescibacteria group bacterium]